MRLRNQELEFNFHFSIVNSDKLVKSQKLPVFVIPANAGIQGNQSLLDSRVRGSDGFGDFLRDHQYWLSIRQKKATEEQISLQRWVAFVALNFQRMSILFKLWRYQKRGFVPLRCWEFTFISPSLSRVFVH